MLQPIAPFDYEKEFPPLEEYSDSQGQNPTTIEADGTKKKITQVEAILNWHTNNLLSQNKALSRIEKKVNVIETSLNTETLSLRQVIQ